MPTKSESKSKKQIYIKNIILKILSGSLINFIFLSVMTVVATKLILKNPIDLKAYKFIMLIIVAISSLIGGFVSSRSIKKNGMIIGLLSCIPAGILILALAFIMSNKITYILPISLFIQFCFSALGGIAGVNMKKLKR